jgi:hypothetical protein
MTTKQQRAANRRNAQRSTGPRTASGRRRVAMNAVTHGLSIPLQADENREMVEHLSDLLIPECGSVSDAEFLALKICEYERTVAHQHTLMSEQGGHNPTSADERVRSRDELLLMASIDEMLGEAAGREDITSADKQWFREAQSLLASVQRQEDRRVKRDALDRLRTADRYHRRAANQLIKALKGL